MIDTMISAVETAATSPWFYLLLLALVLGDAVLPVLPGEAVLIAGGVIAGTSETLRVAPLVGAGAVGAVLGGLVSYAIGQRLGPRILGADATTWRGRLSARVVGLVQRRGRGAIVVAHFLPGGRNLAALAAGAGRLPRRVFVAGAVLGAMLWAGIITGAGYLGGAGLQDQPVLALGVSLAAAGAVALAAAAAQVVADRVRRPRVESA